MALCWSFFCAKRHAAYLVHMVHSPPNSVLTEAMAGEVLHAAAREDVAEAVVVLEAEAKNSTSSHVSSFPARWPLHRSRTILHGRESESKYWRFVSVVLHLSSS